MRAPVQFRPLHQGQVSAEEAERRRKREHDRRRAAAKPWRGWYGTQRWRRMARAQLDREPLCAECVRQDVVTSATVADHIVPHRGDAGLFWGGKLQSLCASCHSRVKQAEERRG